MAYGKGTTPLPVIFDWMEEHVSAKASEDIKNCLKWIRSIKPATLWDGNTIRSLTDKGKQYAQHFNQMTGEVWIQVRDHTSWNHQLGIDRAWRRIFATEACDYLSSFIDSIVRRSDNHQISETLQDMRKSWENIRLSDDMRSSQFSFYFDLHYRFNKRILPILQQAERANNYDGIPPELSVFILFSPISVLFQND